MSTSKHNPIINYITGFILSVLLTLTAYFVVVVEIFNGSAAIAVLLGLALVQLAVQLLFFLHMDQESKPRWALVSFCFMLFFVIVIVIGSLWIMHNLDYNMMPNHDIDREVMEDEAIYR